MLYMGVDNLYTVIKVDSSIGSLKINPITIMNRKTSLGMGGLALALMLTVGVSVVMAADNSSSADSFVSHCGQSIQKGYGMMSDTIANLLGMSQEEIQTERGGGKSISEIAQEKDIAEQELIGGMLEAKTQNFQEAVESGYLTQEQADERMEWMKEKIERKVENGGGRFGRGSHEGCGGCHR